MSTSKTNQSEQAQPTKIRRWAADHTSPSGHTASDTGDMVTFRDHLAAVAERDEAIRVLAKTIVVDRGWSEEATLMIINDHDQDAERLEKCARECDAQQRILQSNPIARAAVDAAKEKA